MTQARIELRLDLETSGSQPFRRKPSSLALESRDHSHELCAEVGDGVREAA